LNFLFKNGRDNNNKYTKRNNKIHDDDNVKEILDIHDNNECYGNIIIQFLEYRDSATIMNVIKEDTKHKYITENHSGYNLYLS